MLSHFYLGFIPSWVKPHLLKVSIHLLVSLDSHLKKFPQYCLHMLIIWINNQEKNDYIFSGFSLPKLDIISICSDFTKKSYISSISPLLGLKKISLYGFRISFAFGIVESFLQFVHFRGSSHSSRHERITSLTSTNNVIVYKLKFRSKISNYIRSIWVQNYEWI